MRRMFGIAFAILILSSGSAFSEEFNFNGVFTVRDYIEGSWNEPSEWYTMTISGQLTATNNGDGTFTATAGSGYANGVPIILVPPSSLGYVEGSGTYYAKYFWTLDFKLIPGSSPIITQYGLLFTSAEPSPLEIYIWYHNASTYDYMATADFFRNWTDSWYTEEQRYLGGTFTITPATGDLTVSPVDPNPVIPGNAYPVTLTFTELTSSGTTSVSSSSTGTPPPNGFRVGSPSVYYNISTTATYTGPIQVCVNYNGVSYGNENNLRLLHREDTNGDNIGDKWVDITSPGYPDVINKLICGTAHTLSPFALFEYSAEFVGFLAPIENTSQLNTVKAGSTVPAKWQLKTTSGQYINSLDAVTINYREIACPNTVVENQIDEQVISYDTGSLHYDSLNNQYVYNWKTSKVMTGKCYKFTTTLFGFQAHDAYFKMK